MPSFRRCYRAGSMRSGEMALTQQVEALATCDDHHAVGLERGLDPFAQQRLGQRADAPGAAEPAELGH